MSVCKMKTYFKIKIHTTHTGFKDTEKPLEQK